MDNVWADSHSHLADLRWSQWGGEADLDQVMARARTQGIGLFLQGGVDPQDWQRQKELQARFHEILPVFGLHPYFVAANSEADCELALDELAKLLPQAKALGETGLDFRPHISQGSEARQIAMFEAQIELAGSANLPLILHVVRAFEEALRVVDLFLIPSSKIQGMVHSFNGSLAQAEKWIERGFLISVGGSLCKPDNQKLHQAVAHIPFSHLVIETDSPDQRPPDWPRAYNEPSSLLKVAEKVAELRHVTMTEVRDRTRENLLGMLNVGQ